MTGREPDVVVGKPGTLLLEMALSSGELTPSECVIIGDTPEADIAAGNALGMRTVLVLSGNSEGVEEGNAPGYPASMQPDAIIGSVVELVP